MDPSGLANTVKELETLLDSLGGWLEFWTALVVIGLVVEYAESVRELIVKKPFDWKILRTLLGGLLITAGVAGELYTQFKAAKVESGLRDANHAVQAELNKKAQEALARAEQEALERTRLEAQVAPRRLTLEQQQAIASSCKRFAGRVLTITSYQGDTEALVLAEQIGAAMNAAGLKTALNLGALATTGELLIGVQVSGPQSKRDLVSVVESSLKSDGHLLIANRQQSPVPPGRGSMQLSGISYGPNEASIFVGVKPPVLLQLP